MVLARLGSAYELEDTSIDDVKRAYLSCDRAAIDGRLDTPGIMLCSVAYEELKDRAFGGDFDKLSAWSDAQPSKRSTGP